MGIPLKEDLTNIVSENRLGTCCINKNSAPQIYKNHIMHNQFSSTYELQYPTKINLT